MIELIVCRHHGARLLLWQCLWEFLLPLSVLPWHSMMATGPAGYQPTFFR